MCSHCHVGLKLRPDSDTPDFHSLHFAEGNSTQTSACLFDMAKIGWWNIVLSDDLYVVEAKVSFEIISHVYNLHNPKVVDSNKA